MVTIRDIAQAVGVSTATVSRVLNYDTSLSISAAKRRAIIETAESLNYLTPRNRNRGPAAAPAPGAPVKVVVVHSLRPAAELADPYYVGVRLGIEHRCQELRLDFAKVYVDQGRENPALLEGAAGIIAVGPHMPDHMDWLAAVSRNLVYADVVPPAESCDRIRSDLGLATERLLEGLWAAGYRKIGFIGAAETPLPGRSRFDEPRTAAYLRWTAARGIAEPDLCDLANMRFEDGYELARTMLRRNRPEVIIAANDNMAIGAYRAILEAGLTIPGDVGVVGFNDIPAAQFLAPPLTTVRIHAERIGEGAVDLLAELIGGRDYFKKIDVSTEIVWRESCRVPPGTA